MDGHDQAGSVRHGDQLAANLADRECAAGQAPGSSDAESHNGVRLDQTALEIEPDFAAFDFVIFGPFVKPALAAHFMLEVLHGVGDEGFRSPNACVLQRLIEDPAGWPDKWLAGDIFFIARLFTHKHEGSMARPLAGDSLRG